MLLSQLQYICEQMTIGRDPSHGVDHMVKVTQNTSRILDEMRLEDTMSLYRIAIAVAMMHDVADHKYVDDPAETFDIIKNHECHKGCNL